MTLVRVRHIEPDGRVRWRETIVRVVDADALVWSTNPADAALFALASLPRQEVLAWFAARVSRGKVELVEERTA